MNAVIMICSHVSLPPTVVSPCISTPCQNGGLCTNTAFGEFICNCAGGFTGTICDTTMGKFLKKHNDDVIYIPIPIPIWTYFQHVMAF